MTPQVQLITAAEEHQVVVAHTVVDPMADLVVVLVAAEVDRLVVAEEDNFTF
jgi:hypothetical protein